MNEPFYIVKLITKNCHTNPREFSSKDEAIEFAAWLDDLWSKEGREHEVHLYEAREIEYK